MPFVPLVQEKCPKCGKAVYSAEERLAAGKKWHKMCLKCGMCSKLLDSMTVAEHEGEIFCKNCHGRKFGPKGYGFGGGAGALSMDTGRQFGNAECEMGVAPTSAGVQGPTCDISKGGCPRCGKKVYDAEKAIGCPDGMSFHKSCWRCKTCSGGLDSTTMCLSKEDNDVYCKSCYAKKFGPKGKI